MLLYLDLNCFHRPFDDQNQDRIAQETTAALAILQRIVDGVDQLLWSAILDLVAVLKPPPEADVEVGDVGTVVELLPPTALQWSSWSATAVPVAWPR